MNATRTDASLLLWAGLLRAGDRGRHERARV